MAFQLLEGRLDRRSRAIETVVRALGVGLYEARHQTKADQIYEGEVFFASQPTLISGAFDKSSYTCSQDAGSSPTRTLPCTLLDVYCSWRH